MEEVVEVALAVRRLSRECCVPTWAAAAAINDANGSVEEARLLLNAGATRFNYVEVVDVRDTPGEGAEVPTLTVQDDGAGGGYADA